MADILSPPQCTPLKTLEEVLTWKPRGKKRDWDCASFPLSNPRKLSEQSVKAPLTLVCHDFKGGYLEDSFYQGVESSEVYRFFHWAYVDVFVYFSHYFVTIPPPCWTNAGHKHGTLVLGTVITEWDAGAATCQKFLQSEDAYKAFADQLVSIAQSLCFDGWLINIENKIEKDSIPNLVGFLQYLTEAMHESLSHSLVIWYDSVTVDGELKWQDELNELNSVFFEACDGIYLNYSWNDEKLQRSASLCSRLNRPFDVYAGIDVFGRQTIGGGGFNSKVALEPIRQHNLSTAIFAPAWVFECLNSLDFSANEYRFWGELLPWLAPHPYVTLPLFTTFCQGQGSQYFQYGKVNKKAPWTNLTMQNMQPLIPRQPLVSDVSVSYCTDDAYGGGGCIRYQGNGLSQSSNPLLTFRLFDLICDTSQSHQRFFLLYTFKNHSEICDNFLDLTGYTSPDHSESVTCRLVGRHTVIPTADSSDTAKKIHIFKPLNNLHTLPKQLQTAVQCHEKHGSESGWTTRAYIVHGEPMFWPRYIDIGFLPGIHFDMSLGQILISRLDDVPPEFHTPRVQLPERVTVRWEDDRISLSCLAQWKAWSPWVAQYLVYYREKSAAEEALLDDDTHHEYKMLGACVPNQNFKDKVMYMLCNLELPPDRSVSAVLLKIQPQLKTGVSSPLTTLPPVVVHIDEGGFHAANIVPCDDDCTE